MSIESIDATQIFTGRRVFFIGATGFVGKVALSMLLCRFPGIGKVFTLVRPGSGMNARERFFKKIAASRPFDPLRERFGDALPGFLEDKVVPLGGDVSQPRIGLSDADLALLTAEPLHAVINCAGLVSFNPSLESALRINVNGVRHTIDLARRTGAALIHVSTCFVAGNRDGEVWEDEPLIGYFPRKDELRDDDFSAEAEIADCERLIAQTRARADDRARVSLFRDRGAQRLIKEGRDPDDERHLRAAVQRERKMWMAEALTDLGMERARHWGWPNTYTYTKSLGDQLCALAAQTPTETGAPLRVAIVRPAIVESAMRYPFPGWNEGFNTTAPLIFMALKGQIQIPAGKDAVLDVIPVDMVASGLIAATAASIAGANKLIYQLGSSDLNPFRMARSAELTGLYRRRYYRARRDESVLNRVRARMESIPVTKERYQLASLPLFRDMGSKLSRLIEENIPTWGAPRVAAFLEHAKEQIDGIVQVAEQGVSIFDLFMPFIYDNAIAFRCDHTRDLFARLAPHDRAALSWEPEAINWREYFMNVHLPGLEKWIFPSLDEEFQARPKAVYTYRDLLELFAAATKHYRGRTAMRLLAPPGPDGEPQGEGLRYTYRDLQERAGRMAAALIQKGVGPGSKVVIMSENRPEWGMAYFGVLKAGATAVPVDSSATADELANIRRASRAQAVLLSRKVAERLQLEPGTDGVSLLEDLGLAGSTALVHVPVPTLPTAGRADEMASLLFTSGTTGRPKGVMLSHRNFTSLLAKLGAIFDLDRHDGLLSVLPLHHTFEFTAGLLMPLMRGAQISYLQEITPESLSAAFRSQLVTGMVGVPALWQVLYRRVVKQLTERPFLDSPWVVRLFEEALHLFYRLRDSSLRSLGADVNVSRLLLFPVHRRFGGRIRLLISGGSALPAEIMKVMRGLGFHLYEGYGLTEAAPVLTVTRPGQPLALGSVGAPLPGIDLKLHEPDESGVGEVIASGPNIMAGYYEDPEATSEVLKDGFLRTGDLGRFDEEGRLYIVGRRKDVIIGMNGENVYPDELEDCYRECPYLKELSVVGLPAQDQGGDGKRDEVVACLAVPSYEGHGLSREEVRERLREHFQKVSARLPPAKRIKVLHLTDIELPRTSTRKVKRKLVVEELLRLGRVQKQAAAARQADGDGGGVGFLAAVLAEVTGKRRDGITEATALQELGLDSLTYAELGVALEAAGVAVPGGADLSGVGTVGELLRLVNQWGQVKEKAKDKARHKARDRSRGPRGTGGKEDDADTVRVPEILRRAGDEGLNLGQRMLYERYLDTRITGQAYLPRASRFIVAANHASHLDMGLVKYALGEWGDRLVALAARDYFFEDPLRRVYFENFTSLIPMDRHGSIRESLRLSEEVIRQGHILLIFPEGTRSESGVMKDFKPSIGYLALHNQIDVLPMYLRGTHDAMPKGRFLPQRRTVWAHIGPVVSYRAMRAGLAGVPRTEHNRTVAHMIEQAVRRLAPGEVEK